MNMWPPPSAISHRVRRCAFNLNRVRGFAVCLPYLKFDNYNIGDKHNIVAGWASATVYEKMDGALINLCVPVRASCCLKSAPPRPLPLTLLLPTLILEPQHEIGDSQY